MIRSSKHNTLVGLIAPVVLAGCASNKAYEAVNTPVAVPGTTVSPAVSGPAAMVPPAAPSPSAPVAAGARKLADAHFHLVDFLQRTDGIRAVLTAMDVAGVTDAMITGMPLVKKWSKEDVRQPLYYLEDESPVYWYSATDVLVAREVLSAPESERHRLHPFITGFNPTDRNAIDHVKRMVEWYPGVWQGIGEVITHHDELTGLTPGEVARPDNIALDPVFDYAADHDLPVSIHSNIGAVWIREPIFLPEVEAMLKKHPRTRFMWCHAGIGRRIMVPTLTTELRRLLGSYPNLWVDVSWVVFENYIAPEGKLQSDWVELVKAFPNRFMIGSDIVGHFGKYTGEIRKYDILLDALPDDVARRLARDNFMSVLPAAVRAQNR